ncbi:MAG: glutathione S-transferase C-terminal domain-containing protein [Lachnospiraceae bacterium]|nr:glutathione S-transferase C-terminal domain-containing protein [Lachnospiraceae bacterium]
MANVCDLSAHQAKTSAQGPAPYTDEEARENAKKAGVKERPKVFYNELDADGGFIRQANTLLQSYGDGPDKWPVEAGRYRIYWAKGCNWSNRPVIARNILGLQDVITDELLEWTGETNQFGWGFRNSPGHQDPDTGAYFLSEFYENTIPGFNGRATTPTVVDIIDKKATNNDYHRLTNYIEVQFRALQPADAPDLYPKKYRKEIDEFNDWLFDHVNNGHYRMAFTRNPDIYQEAFDDFYGSLDKLEKRLGENRFLFGDYITDSDIRLFVSLNRWDLAYFKNIGPVRRRIVDYKNIWGYLRELYAIPAFKDATYLEDFARGRSADTGDADFADWHARVASKLDLQKLWADDGQRKVLSAHPDEVYLRHPEGETPEDYQSEISFCPWNSEKQEDRDPRNPKNGQISVDPSINPLKGLL